MTNRRKFLIGAVAATSVATLPVSLSALGLGNCVESSFVELGSGRRLGYSTFGDPRGWPVLYFHGIPTSRIEARFFASSALAAGCNLIAIDRPGFGLSDFQCGRRVVDWLEDLKEFIDSSQLPKNLDLGQFSIASFSSGAAYALLGAAFLPVDRLRSIGMVAPIAPLQKIQGDGGVAQTMFRLAANRPNIARNLLKASARHMRKRPDKVLRITSRFFSKCDQSVFSEPCHAQILIDSYLECVRCGPEGVRHDMAILGQPWGFCLENIDRSIGLWYGQCDITTPVASMGGYLSRALKKSKLSIIPGQGLLSMLNRTGDELFQHLIATAY